MTSPAIGTIATCAETGQQFVIAPDGCSFNYATDSAGNILSDAGVDIREKRGLLDRSRPFVGYISSDGHRLTGWKGNTLGQVVSRSTVRLARYSWVHGRTITAYVIRDVHGAYWHGRSSPEIAITIRPRKPLT